MKRSAVLVLMTVAVLALVTFAYANRESSSRRQIREDRASACAAALAFTRSLSSDDQAAVSRLYYRPLGPAEYEAFRSLVPTSLDTGFEAPWWNRPGPRGSEVHVQHPDDTGFAVLVGMKRDDRPEGWVVTSFSPVDPK